MKKSWISLVLILAALNAYALDPAKITMTNYREEAVSDASSAVFYRGDVIHFTNCVVYAGADTNSARQNLTGLTILLSVGDAVDTSSVATGQITTATSGVWNAIVTLGADESAKTFLELRLTNSTDSFSYPFKTITTKTKL